MIVFNEYYYLKYLSKDNFYKIKLYGYEKESGTLFDIESNRVYNTKNNLFIEDLKRDNENFDEKKSVLTKLPNSYFKVKKIFEYNDLSYCYKILKNPNAKNKVKNKLEAMLILIKLNFGFFTDDEKDKEHLKELVQIYNTLAEVRYKIINKKEYENEKV